MAAHVSLQYVAPAMRRSEQHFVSVRLHGGQEQASSTVARREQQGIGRVELHELLSVMESGRAFRRVRRLGCFKIGEGGERSQATLCNSFPAPGTDAFPANYLLV